jgi:CheY-like chemotaxis protein
MERILDSTGPSSTPWRIREGKDRRPLPSVLVVDDDPDIRDMLAMLLELTGFAPVCCDSADAALGVLRARRFDVILTDYALPVHSGIWMLQQAQAERLIDGVPVLIATAHSNLPDASRYEIIRKPFDLDELVARIERRLQRRVTPLPRTSAVIARPPGRRHLDGSGRDEDDPDLELILYVGGSRSIAELEHARRLLSQSRSLRVRVTMCHRIDETECPMERTPRRPQTFLLGHIENLDMLLALIGECEDQLIETPLAHAPSRTANNAPIDSSAPVNSRRSRAKQKRT